jgi:hypothetical protein
MFGAAIYFASTPESAQHKAVNDRGSDGMMIVADVDFGKALVINGPRRDLTRAALEAQGADSVKGRSGQNADWEYAVFDSKRITIIRIYASPGPSRCSGSGESAALAGGLGLVGLAIFTVCSVA